MRSRYRIVYIGVPQGLVLSPALFNFFVSYFPEPNQLKSSFADDFSVAAYGPNLQVIEAALNDDMAKISAWAAHKHLSISTEKSQVTLFTPHTKEFHDQPKIFYQGTLVSVANTIKIIGQNLDTSHTGTPLEKAQATKGCSRLLILKAVMGANWGFQKEDGLVAFKAFIGPVFGYAGPVWFPICSKLKSPIDRLQAIQNAGLRLIMGCHAAASEQHLHDECKVLLVADHLNMHCAQFLDNSRQLGHPSFEVTSRPPGAHPSMKPTLRHSFGNRISMHLRDGVLPESNYIETSL
jgi:hypothetical protein